MIYRYRLTPVATKCGRGTFYLVDRYSEAGTLRSVGSTRNHFTYPASVRARTAAENLARRHAKQHGVRCEIVS
jgi:hypothetical protein